MNTTSISGCAISGVMICGDRTPCGPVVIPPGSFIEDCPPKFPGGLVCDTVPSIGGQCDPAPSSSGVCVPPPAVTIIGNC